MFYNLKLFFFTEELTLIEQGLKKESGIHCTLAELTAFVCTGMSPLYMRPKA